MPTFEATRAPTTAPIADSSRADAHARGTSELGHASPVRGVGTRLVIAYVVLALGVLAPGLLLRLGLGDSLPAAWRAPLVAHLNDIRFGSGLRFWLGVVGAVSMGLLLLYPLRKTWARGRWLGSVSSWFHIHIVIGLLGPVLILYHANFGLGGANANVALWAMLAVVASGIAGHFVYASASAEFYAGRQRARAQIDAIAALLAGLGTLHEERASLVEALEAFEAELLTPRRGILASLRARWRIETRRHRLARELGWHLAACTQALGLSEAEHARLRLTAGRHLAAYVRIARHASTRSVREQMWARWRLFHLPVFLVMAVATVLHVAAVWGLDDPAAPEAPEPARVLEAARKPIGAVTRTAARPATPPVTSASEARRLAAPSTGVPVPVLRVPLARVPVEPVPGSAAEMPRPVTGLISPPRPVEVPIERPRPEPRASGAARIEPAPTARAIAPPAPPKPTVEPAQKPAPQIARAPERPAQPEAAPATRPDGDIGAVYETLTRKAAELPMGLGAARPRTLSEQLADLKAKRQAGLFAHSDAETGFALTGKHLKADCASCHTKPLSPTRQATVRTCIACHKQDDVHRGRRPDCARCHTTNRWSEIIRRR